MSFLELRSLTKQYGKMSAVSSLSLSVNKGEFICLLGPSGCGKTTTLQMIAGLIEPTSGSVLLNGQDITGLKPSRRGLGIVFQSYALFPHMTVAQNVSFGLEMRRVPLAERRDRVAEALDLVHLGDFEQRYPSELSGGQRQRVALARALVIKPPVLLLDEPMAALDAKLREDMQIELRALQQRVAITTIMVTHSQSEAMTLADRVVLMNRGEIEQLGVPYEMYEKPNGRFASTFLGKANVFVGTANGSSVAVSSFKLPVAQPQFEGEVEYIIRPEKIAFTDQQPLIEGLVRARVFLGSQWLYEIETEAGSVHVSQPNTGAPKIAEGDRVGLTWAGRSAQVIRSPRKS